MTKTAMIDVGGGFRAIFGCGVMDRMLEDGIDVDMCYGVSAGAANMTSFIARQHGRNHTFYTKYAFRKEYASAESFFKNHNFANLDYIYGTLSNHDGENPLDFAAFEANETGFTVVACNAEDGSTKYFDKSRVRLMISTSSSFVRRAGGLRAVCGGWRAVFRWRHRRSGAGAEGAGGRLRSRDSDSVSLA